MSPVVVMVTVLENLITGSWFGHTRYDHRGHGGGQGGDERWNNGEASSGRMCPDLHVVNQRITKIYEYFSLRTTKKD